MTNILIFGDSITWGAFDKKGGWTQRIKSFVYEKTMTDTEYDCDIYSLGVSGDNVEKLIKRVKCESISRLGKEETIIIFAIGINDSQILEDGPKFSIEQFEKNLDILLKEIKKYVSKIIFLGLTPVDNQKVNPIPWNLGKSYTLENVKVFNDSIANFCKNNNLDFIKTFDVFIRKNYRDMLYDGLHPNSEGHEEIYNLVRNYLVDEKII